ncbi:MAG: hypothetical protein PHS37_01495 [Candidatus Omnitrophica bacterium]|nr:hypothetical protein [Candidatus Omnitrophota bacterium]
MTKIVSNERDSKDEVFSQEIVDTFFRGSFKTKPPEIPQAPINQKLPAQRAETARKPYLQKALLGVMLAAVIAAAGYIVYSHNSPGASSGGDMRNENYARLFNDGSFDRYLVKIFSFDGDAREKSLISSNSLKLANTGSLGWARATFQLNTPVDLSRSNLMVLTKSEPGIKAMTLVLTDTGGNTRRIPMTLSPRWEWKSITIQEKNYFNERKVSIVAFEYGQTTAGNDPASEIYIKEIGLRTKQP